MAFFDKKDLPSNQSKKRRFSKPKMGTQPKTYHWGWAENFVGSLMRKDIISQAVSWKVRQDMIARGYHELRKLTDEFGKKEVNRVIHEFEPYMMEEFAPRVHSIQTFCAKFKQIQKYLAAKLEYSGSDKLNSHGIVIEQKVNEAWNLPKSYKLILPNSISASMRNYRRMVLAMDRIQGVIPYYIKKHTLGRSDAHMVEFLVTWYNGIFSWFDVFDPVLNPSYEHLTFSVLSNRFQRTVLGEMMESNGESRFDLEEVARFKHQLRLEYGRIDL